MKLLELLSELEEVIDQSSSFILTGKKMVDAEVIAEILDDIRKALPEELETAQIVVKDKQRIMLDAQKEAESMVKQAEDRINELINEHELTQRAYLQSQEILSQAQQSAREIRLGSKSYAIGILEDIMKDLQNMEETVKQNISELSGR